MSIDMNETGNPAQARAAAPQAFAAPVRELRDSLLLFALTASTLGAYVGLAMAIVKVVTPQ
jgi:hypothetical protein